jgi:hypothetical protein
MIAVAVWSPLASPSDVLMKRLFWLIPVLAVGCDSQDTTAPGRTAPSVARADSPPPKPKAVDKVPEARAPEVEEPKEVPPEEAPPIPAEYKPLNKNKTLFFEKTADDRRRVHILAAVCLREGVLEVLLCKQFSKEHESILHADVDGQALHTALVAAKAVPGSPVVFHPDYKPASGTRIKVTLTYREKGKVKTVPAGEWIKDKTTNKDMAHDWVFAGSKLLKDPDNPAAPPAYTAHHTGEYICLANFPDSIMDLPVKSPKDLADLIFEINTPRIPPLRTPVIVTLEPVLEGKKK